MRDRRLRLLRPDARSSPNRLPVLKFNPPPERPKYVSDELPASLPMTWKRAAGLALLALASVAILALQVWAILGSVN